jgi:EAL domain-containing protein (putative c-di-GMP-specific phosphodiesterase class I)
MADADRSAILLSQFKTLGVRLDIDDFGTGYSSAGYRDFRWTRSKSIVHSPAG